MFQNDENCMVLLMDGSAALGLDLSFVSHVFLMEPIWDKRLFLLHFTHSIHIILSFYQLLVVEVSLQFLFLQIVSYPFHMKHTKNTIFLGSSFLNWNLLLFVQPC